MSKGRFTSLMLLPVGFLAFLKQAFSDSRKERSNYLFLTLEQYETSLHALQAILPGFLQTAYFSACTLAHGKAVGGGYRGCKDSSIIRRNAEWS